MTHSDQDHVFERITALWESHGKAPTGGALETAWGVLSGVGIDDFNEACRRAAKLGKLFPSDILAIARDAQRDRLAKSRAAPNTFRCNAHEADPDVISANPTMSWCDRCRHFVSNGRQEPDIHDVSDREIEERYP